jgi:transcription elongation factor Elf1
MRRRAKRKPPLPPRHLLPRLPKQPPTARKECPQCGKLDRTVSTRQQLTYYGPTKCKRCGAKRPLRKVERPIDWALVKATYSIPRDCNIPELRAA